MGCSAADVAGAIRAIAAVVAEHRVELIQLDRAIGDGDHGENLDRGFRAVVSKLDESTPDTPGGVLKLVATTLDLQGRWGGGPAVRHGVPACLDRAGRPPRSWASPR